jgi:signal transduction histidine kinase
MKLTAHRMPWTKLHSRFTSVLFPKFPAQLEAEFKQHYNNISASVAWISLLLGEAIYMAFYFWDRVVDYANSSKTLIVRLIISVWFMIVTLFPRPMFTRYMQELMASTITLAGIGVVIIISIVRDGLVFAVSGVVLVLMFNFGFFRLLFVPALLSGIVICMSYSLAAITAGVNSAIIVANNFFLISALISGASITYLLERLFREQFLNERELSIEREALARQHQVDSRYLDWLRRLARFLRHEVRQPVAQLNSSIELISLTCGHDQRITKYINGASVAVQQVWELIERASRATDAEAFVRQGASKHIDLHEMLAEIVASHERTSSGFHIQLVSRPSALIQADPNLIKEAVENLLGNAASFAEDDSTIQVRLDTDNRLVVISVRNRGPVVQGDTEEMFKPFVSSRSGSSGEHQGLGLYLVRLIAEQYGGRASLTNLDDGSGVEASIVLPVAST